MFSLGNRRGCSTANEKNEKIPLPSTNRFLRRLYGRPPLLPKVSSTISVNRGQVVSIRGPFVCRPSHHLLFAPKTPTVSARPGVRQRRRPRITLSFIFPRRGDSVGKNTNTSSTSTCRGTSAAPRSVRVTLRRPERIGRDRK